MQLTTPNVRQALALATCALVHGGAQAAEGEWKISGSLLSYAEKDRVSVIAPTLFATMDLGNEESLTLRTVYDALTGASPNGASATTTPQTFGKGTKTYTTAAYDLPLKAFSDSRIAFGVDWATRPSSVSGRTLTANFSRETDYASFGGSGTWTRDINNKLTTLAWGVGASYDVVSAASGPPVGLESLNAVKPKETKTYCSGHPGLQFGGEGGLSLCGEAKTTFDLMAGVTQVLSRRTLAQFNVGVSYSSGYLTDPYKILSVVDPTTGDTVDYVNENRPSSRLANTFYGKLVHNFGEDVAHLSYRYFMDDWGIKAHTAELQYRYRVNNKFYLEPQFHYHVQQAADFYRHSLPGAFTSIAGNQTGEEFASADLRLADMVTTTMGLKLGVSVGEGEFTVRAVTMTEKGESHPSDAIGVQKQVDLYPTLEATIVTLGYSTPL